jgi:hypothetical protein
MVFFIWFVGVVVVGFFWGRFVEGLTYKVTEVEPAARGA